MIYNLINNKSINEVIKDYNLGEFKITNVSISYHNDNNEEIVTLEGFVGDNLNPNEERQVEC